MTSISFPRQALPVGSEDSFYLDTSFAVACLSYERNCLDLLIKITGRPTYVSSVVWAEAVHVLVRTYLADDLQKAMAGEKEELVHPEIAPVLLSEFIKDQAGEGGFWVRRACHDVLKSPSAQLREMLLPYQRSAVAAVDSFLSDSGASFLTIGADVLEKAKAICRAVPCDTNDALHLASALKGKCSYAVTKDADWVWIPDAFRPAVVRVA